MVVFQLHHTPRSGATQVSTKNGTLSEPLNTLLNTYAFRGPADSTELAIIFSVHGQEIAPADSAETPAYRLRFFAAVQDSLTRQVVRSDSLVSITVPERFGPDAVVRYTPSLVTQASGTATIRASVRNQVDTLQGQIVRTTRAIPSFATDSLAMSDLVIAEPRTGNWVRHGVGLEPIAGNRLIANQPFRLFYELYGVPQDEIVDVDIELTPDRPTGPLGRIADLISRREAMSLHFQEPVQLARPDVAAVTRDITAELEPGDYTLSVKVDAPPGRCELHRQHVGRGLQTGLTKGIGQRRTRRGITGGLVNYGGCGRTVELRRRDVLATGEILT